MIFTKKKIIYLDRKTRILIQDIEELPGLNLPLHEELVVSRNGGALTDKAVFMGIGESFYIWSPTEYESQYTKSQKILKEKGPPKLILKKQSD